MEWFIRFWWQGGSYLSGLAKMWFIWIMHHVVNWNYFRQYLLLNFCWSSSADTYAVCCIAMHCRCLSENGWDYTKSAQVFIELNVSQLSSLGPPTISVVLRLLLACTSVVCSGLFKSSFFTVIMKSCATVNFTAWIPACYIADLSSLQWLAWMVYGYYRLYF